MPTYDYRCKDCDNEFELVQSFSANTLKKCPRKAVEGCANPGKGQVRKLFGNVGISFKGDGFYKNDARSKSSSAKTEKSESGSKSSGTDTKKSSEKSDSGSSTSSDTKKKSSDSSSKTKSGSKKD